MKTAHYETTLTAPDAGDVCGDCGGDNRFDAWPDHPRGCNCDARRASRAMRDQANAIARAGSINFDDYARFLRDGTVLRGSA